MLNEILLGGSIATVSGLVGFFISKKLTSANSAVRSEHSDRTTSASSVDSTKSDLNISFKSPKFFNNLQKDLKPLGNSYT